METIKEEATVRSDHYEDISVLLNADATFQDSNVFEVICGCIPESAFLKHSPGDAIQQLISKPDGEYCATFVTTWVLGAKVG